MTLRRGAVNDVAQRSALAQQLTVAELEPSYGVAIRVMRACRSVVRKLETMLPLIVLQFIRGYMLR